MSITENERSAKRRARVVLAVAAIVVALLVLFIVVNPGGIIGGSSATASTALSAASAADAGKNVDKAADKGGASASPSPTASPTATPSASSEPPALSAELKALLDAGNAPLNEYQCLKILRDNKVPVIDDTYTLFLQTIIGVKEGDMSLRQWSDAMSTVLQGNTVEEIRTWLNRAICQEPLVGVSLAHLFAHLEVEGTRVLDIQTTDWLAPFNVDASQINDLAAKYLPLSVWRLQNPGGSTPPNEVYSAAMAANLEYQNLASRLIYLLSKYELATQVMSIDSTHNYHLVAGGLTADGVPEVEVTNTVDSRPALVFYLTEKNADNCKPLSVLGFNVGDKRPMLGTSPDTCAPFLPPPPPPVHVPSNPGTPWIPSNPNQPYNPPGGNDQKDYNQSSGAKGNADTGSGQNADTGPGTYVPPQEMEQPPATPHVNPAPPAPAPPAPAPAPAQPAPAPVPTKDSAPAPPPEKEAPVEQEGCTPPPGMTSC